MVQIDGTMVLSFSEEWSHGLKLVVPWFSNDGTMVLSFTEVVLWFQLMVPWFAIDSAE